jgi:hypothetical protein
MGPLLLLLSAAACSDGGSATRPITATRDFDVDPATQEKVGATSAERFGTMGPPAAARGDASDHDGAKPELIWDNPEGWIELPPTQYRTANLQPAGNPDLECYLTVLQGDGGGLASNVNRWRGQMGLPAIDAAGVAALPRQPLLGLDAVRLDLEGNYGGMGGDARPGWTMVGLIAQFGQALLTVKLTGPTAAVAGERARFDEFVKSLRLEAPDAAAHDHGDPKDNGAAAGPAGGAAGDAAAGAPMGSGHGIQFTAPQGWTREKERPARIATLRPGGTTQSECSIIVLGGDGGGLAGNVDRWRGQLGLAKLPAGEFEKLPRVPMCGREAILFDATGTFDDSMNDRKIAQARMVGAMVALDGRALFVKLSGPESEIDDRVRDAFRELCASLRE